MNNEDLATVLRWVGCAVIALLSVLTIFVLMLIFYVAMVLIAS